MNKETIAMHKIMVALASTKATIFRNNVGMAYQGDKYIDPVTKKPYLTNLRPVHFGLHKGSSDIIGWTQVTITPDMVGKTLAVFTAVEVKTPQGKESSEQARFIERVKEAGGLAGFARTEQDAKTIIDHNDICRNGTETPL